MMKSKRDHKIQFRVSLEEARQIDELAESAGWNRCEYLRMATLYGGGIINPIAMTVGSDKVVLSEERVSAFDEALTEVSGTQRLRGIFRATQSELRRIDERARACGISRSEYVKLCALAQKLPAQVNIPEVNQSVYIELGRICGLLNQYLKHLNRGVATLVPPNLLAELMDQVKLIREQLLGITSDDC
jgi:hypothetical protein